MSNNNKIRISLVIIAGILAFFAFFHEEKEIEEIKPIVKVEIAENIFNVIVADTQVLRTKGLSGHLKLDEKQGMLFIFDDSAMRGFWMKEMNFPLDMVWIDENLKVIGITVNATPESFPEVFQSITPVQYVLEINAYGAESNGIIIGEEVGFIRN